MGAFGNFEGQSKINHFVKLWLYLLSKENYSVAITYCQSGLLHGHCLLAGEEFSQAITLRGLANRLPKVGESTPKPPNPPNLGVDPPNLSGLGVASPRNLNKKNEVPGGGRS
jgi:hypothetical protein